jgi:Bardet-Biedl syndrome 1 protein
MQWTSPPIELSQIEIEVWNDLASGSIDSLNAVKTLTDARDNGVSLSSRSVELLSLDSDAAKISFIAELKNLPYVQQTVITCLETLNKESDAADAVCHLVVGTEAGEFYILPCDPFNSNYICKVKLSSTPVMLDVSGFFDVDWRVTATCRDGKLYNIKNGDVRNSAVLSGSISDLGSQPVATARQDKNLWVATMDRTVANYSSRGKRNKTLVMPDDISDICVMPIKKSKITHLLIVALANGDIRLYQEAALVHVFTVEKPVHAIRYGAYGREENSLILIHGRGSITIKMWRRVADIENVNLLSGMAKY